MTDRTPDPASAPAPAPAPASGVDAGPSPVPETQPPAAQPSGKASSRLAGLKRFGSVIFAILAFFVFRALTADDGTHGIQNGQCVAAVGSDDFKKVDCTDSTSLGSVTYIEKNVSTEETAALRLCSAHGAKGAFTSADSSGGTGTVICVADPK